VVLWTYNTTEKAMECSTSDGKNLVTTHTKNVITKNTFDNVQKSSGQFLCHLINEKIEMRLFRKELN